MDARSFLSAYNHGMETLNRRILLPKWNFLTWDNYFWESCRITREFVDSYMDRALELVQGKNGTSHRSDNKRPRYVLAEELAKETKDKDEIRDGLLNLFFPAHSAIGLALTHIFFLLARHPRVWGKLRAEVETLQTEELTFERLKSLTYLQAIINESFRLHPGVSVNARMCLRDTVLPTGVGPNGTDTVFVGKGDMIMISLSSMYRRKDLFGEDAEEFNPERWETLEVAPWSFLSFSGGPRVCSGKNLTLAHISFTMVKFLQKFRRVDNRDPCGQFVEMYKISTESKNGAKVAFYAA